MKYRGRGGREIPARLRRTALGVALLALGLPARAQDTDHRAAEDIQPSAPAPNRSALDQPPPLILGNPSPDKGSNRPEPGRPPPGGYRWMAYADAVSKELEASLRANSTTRNSRFNVSYEIWIDPKGRVTRVQLVKPSGNADVDAAFRDEILPRLKLPAPARDMPMPITGSIASKTGPFL